MNANPRSETHTAFPTANAQPTLSWRDQPIEPPYADPPVRWCGRGEWATTPPLPIGAHSCPNVPDFEVLGRNPGAVSRWVSSSRDQSEGEAPSGALRTAGEAPALRSRGDGKLLFTPTGKQVYSKKPAATSPSRALSSRHRRVRAARRLPLTPDERARIRATARRRSPGGWWRSCSPRF
jgi:hypothetical protein